MAVKDELGARMKDFYENVPKNTLMRRCPVIVRLDGRAGHTFCKGLQRPFDAIFMKSMQETAKYICENVTGAKMSYQQSDEISILLVDYDKLTSQAFFDYEVQKMCSIIAGMGTLAFNRTFNALAEEYIKNYVNVGTCTEELQHYAESLLKCMETGLVFDCRVFNIPKEEVANYFLWRQLDASRNSVQMVGHANFSQKEMLGKNNSEIQDMLMAEKGINWNDFPVPQKRGTCCIREDYQAESVDIKDGMVIRHRWIIDENIPIFKNEGREYIEKHVFVGE